MGNELSLKVPSRHTSTRKATAVKVHIYDVGTTQVGQALNSILRPFGTGIFHCGVEVHNREWSFGEDGVYDTPPKKCGGHTYCDSIFMGLTTLTVLETLRLLQALEQMWLKAGYDLLTRNCCHFSSSFCALLGVGHLPKWLTSLADAGAAIVAPREGAAKAPDQAELGTLVKERHTIGVKQVDHSASTPVLGLGLGKAATSGKRPPFQVSKPGSQSPGAPAYAWKDEALKRTQSSRDLGYGIYGQKSRSDADLRMPQTARLTMAGRPQVAGNRQKTALPGTQRSRPPEAAPWHKGPSSAWPQRKRRREVAPVPSGDVGNVAKALCGSSGDVGNVAKALCGSCI
mmetsp:Transcript_67003/g.132105  ORF Transcript_67003/g.132105 Transcript_67003/m.132105 type:complete len:343 (-) Transcript_67003:15-1043(-)